MSQKLKTSIGLFSLLALAVPITWATVAGSTDPDVDAALIGELEMPEAELGPVNVNLQDALYRCGLNPEALAAAGVTASQVGSMCDALRADIVMVQPILDAADSGVADGRRNVGRLNRIVRSGKGTTEDVAELSQCKSACDAALAERENCMNHFHAAACEVLSEAQRNTLVNIRANSEWKAPTPYLAVNRTPEQWMQLEEYLDVERIETRWGHDIPEEVATVLAAARADADYAAANTAYETNLAALKVAADASIRD